MKKLLFLAFLSLGFAASSFAQTTISGSTNTSTKQVTYSVTLKAVGSNKPAVIKALMNNLPCTETQAHAFINAIPAVLATGLSKDKAASLERALVNAGASVVVKAEQ